MWWWRIIITLFALLAPALTWKGDKVRLRDVEVLTLREGEWTKGKRSAPVRQLTCTGGSSKGRPQVVQCYNRGWDGHDVQWECKAELEKGITFADLSVTCEGYDYPDDPYILAGSCGLEYSLKGGSWFGGGEKESWWGSSYKTAGLLSELTSGFKSLVVILGGMALLFFFFSTFISNRGGGGGGGDDRRPPPPPPGFRQDYYPPGDSPFDDGCGASQRRTYTNTHQRGGGNGGGFWTGAATGGLLGYLFGRNNTGTRAQERYERNYGPSTSSYSTPRASTSSSSSTYEATGFASTRRR